MGTILWHNARGSRGLFNDRAKVEELATIADFLPAFKPLLQ